MKTVLVFLFLLVIAPWGFSQRKFSSKIEIKTFSAPSIENNRGGENPMRRVSIYLPPGYVENPNQRYPAIYFLHGFGIDETMMMEWMDFRRLMDKAILEGKTPPMILVFPNSDTRLRGSFYTNSEFTGNWANYIGRDIVSFIDKTYRTIPNRDSRGLAGHSMGGNGALKVGMLFPEVFSTVYAMSPAVLNWAAEFHPSNAVFKKLNAVKDEKELLYAFKEPEAGQPDDFYLAVLSSMSRTYAPDAKVPGIQGRLPVRYIGDSMVNNPEVTTMWEKNFPINMIESHLDNLNKLTALKMDWGRNEDFPHIPASCLEFSKKLESLKVKHFAEEYIGTHVSHLAGDDGRVFTEVIPFFATYLKSK